MIKAVAFDFGGVLYTYNHDLLMKDISEELGCPKYRVADSWKRKIEKYELGKISEDEFWASFLGKLRINHDTKTLHNMVISHFRPIKGSLQILREIKKAAITCLVSNQTSWIDDLEKKYKFMKFFDISIVSKDVSLRKPGKGIFDLLLRKARVNPCEIVFVDDTSDYKNAVENIGINFIHFRSSFQLKAALKKYGL